MKINDFCYEYKFEFYGIDLTFVVDHFDQRKRVKRAYMLMFSGMTEDREDLIELGIKHGARPALIIKASHGMNKYVRKLLPYTSIEDIDILRNMTENGGQHMVNFFLSKNPSVKSRVFASAHWQETVKMTRARISYLTMQKAINERDFER